MQTHEDIRTTGAGSVPLKEFLSKWGDALGQKVVDNITPVHNPMKPEGVEKYEEKMGGLLRQPFPSQAEVIKTLAKSFYDRGKHEGILCAEMGCGKSIMGAIVPHLSPEPQRTIVMCPPHLVDKWQREIRITIPGAAVENLSGRESVRKLIYLLNTRAGTKPARPEFYVISRERAKNGYRWESAVNTVGALTSDRMRSMIGQLQDDVRFLEEEGDCEETENETVGALRSKINRIRCSILDPDFVRCPSCGGRVTESTEDGVFPVSVKRLKRKKHTCNTVVGYRVYEKTGDGDGKVLKYRKAPLSFNPSDEERQMLVFEDVVCGSPLWSASGNLRRFSPAEFIKKYLHNFFDFAIFDEVHELKSGESNQGIAFGMIASSVKRVLLLTGTLMGGYADDIFHILYRITPERLKIDGFDYGDSSKWMRNYGVLEETQYIDEEDNRTGRGRSGGKIVKRRPGVSPLVLARHLLDKTVFLKLADVAEGLPPYKEEVVSLRMEGEQKESYESLKDQLQKKIRSCGGKPPMGLISKMLQSLLAYPDSCMLMEEEIRVKDRDSGIDELVASAPRLDEEITTPKEAELIDIVRAERKNGRRVLVYCTFTGSRDITPRISKKLEEAGYRTAILRSSVPPLDREKWILDRVREGVEVVICNPELVKTGLDIYDFPTIVFYQTGYVIPTLRQASRRSWRIGQTQGVRVIFLSYEQSMQSEALRLIAEKLETALAVEGELTDAGLAALSKAGSSLLEDLAKSLAGGTKGSAEEAWAKFRKKEVESDLGLGGEERRAIAAKVVGHKKLSGSKKLTTEVEQLAANRSIKVEIIDFKRPRKKRVSRLEVTSGSLEEALSESEGAVQFALF